MEENGSLSQSNRLKDYKNVWKATNKAIITYRKSGIDHCCREDSDGQESFGEFSWPPKSYTCSFCNREFRSAQALGGHMNVHRREKAKLRQITPLRYLPFLHPQSQFLDLNLHANPNPNITTDFASNTSSFPTMFPPFTSSYSCCLPFSDPSRFHLLCPSNSANYYTFRSRKSNLTVDGFDDFSREKEGMKVNKSYIGLLEESKFDDLDLELRLGCS